MEVWGTSGIGFGDLWAALHWALRKSQAERRIIHLSRYVVSSVDTHDTKEPLSRMMELIDIPVGVQVILSDERPNAQMCGSPWSVRYLPTKRVWSPAAGRKTIAYQFDGRSSADIKNPSQAEKDKFFAWIQQHGLSAVPVGLPHTMEESAAILADVAAFIGCCSGMSTLACGVRTPTFVLEYELKVAWWYGDGVNGIHICGGMNEFFQAYATVSDMR